MDTKLCGGATPNPITEGKDHFQEEQTAELRLRGWVGS